YLGVNFTKQGIYSKFKTLISSLRGRLSLFKSESTTLRSKVAALKSYALPPLMYHFYLDSPTKWQIKKIENLTKWFISAPKTTAYGSSFINTMALDRASFHWDQGGLNLWDIGLRSIAYKVWVFNRFLNTPAHLTHGYLDSWRTQHRNARKRLGGKFTGLFRKFHTPWMEFRSAHLSSHSDKVPLLDSNGGTLSLKDIYAILWKAKYGSIRLTEGQWQLSVFHGLKLPDIFKVISTLRGPSSRNALFRFFSHTLPINHMRADADCTLCGNSCTDQPYNHFFFDCSKVATQEAMRPALDLVKQRSGINVREWNIKALDISTKSSRPNLPFIHLMAIIVNYLWHYIANHLFGNKEALLAKLSLVCITSFKSLLRQEWRSLMSTLTSHILAGRPVNIKNEMAEFTTKWHLSTRNSDIRLPPLPPTINKYLVAEFRGLQ
ncbi:hypothetical protein SAMD00019534_103690, partial [Acytostelium subglobosum LB1]|uniref:hypothetical protein n=1 Tax=Acytostelium subglobosum LB1 TaxID=1410327 RepID=UPI000645191F